MSTPSAAPRCRVCRRESTDLICPPCRENGHTHLATLPGLYAKLATQLPATPNPTRGQPIGRGAIAGRVPADMAALALIGSCTADMAAREDQHPVAPSTAYSIPHWITGWASLWRAHNGHHAALAVRAAHRWSELRWNLIDTKPGRTRDAVRDAVDGDVGTAWQIRFGPATFTTTTRTDLRYLRTWLDYACDTHADTVTFLDQLDRLVAHASAVVGEPNRAVYLGECPEPVVDRQTRVQLLDDDGRPRWCGARIVYHPTVDGRTVTCPRCRTVTPDGMWPNLALRMRDVWGRVGSREAWGR